MIEETNTQLLQKINSQVPGNLEIQTLSNNPTKFEKRKIFYIYLKESSKTVWQRIYDNLETISIDLDVKKIQVKPYQIKYLHRIKVDRELNIQEVYNLMYGADYKYSKFRILLKRKRGYVQKQGKKEGEILEYTIPDDSSSDDDDDHNNGDGNEQSTHSTDHKQIIKDSNQQLQDERGDNLQRPQQNSSKSFKVKLEHQLKIKQHLQQQQLQQQQKEKEKQQLQKQSQLNIGNNMNSQQQTNIFQSKEFSSFPQSNSFSSVFNSQNQNFQQQQQQNFMGNSIFQSQPNYQQQQLQQQYEQLEQILFDSNGEDQEMREMKKLVFEKNKQELFLIRQMDDLKNQMLNLQQQKYDMQNWYGQKIQAFYTSRIQNNNIQQAKENNEFQEEKLNKRNFRDLEDKTKENKSHRIQKKQKQQDDIFKESSSDASEEEKHNNINNNINNNKINGNIDSDNKSLSEY